jgi:hypothetical protein
MATMSSHRDISIVMGANGEKLAYATSEEERQGGDHRPSC